MTRARMLVVALALAALVAVGAVLLSGDDRESRAGGADAPTVATATADDANPVLTRPDELVDEAGPASEVGRDLEPEAVTDERSVVHALGRAIRGEVVLPEGTPIDERVTVKATIRHPSSHDVKTSVDEIEVGADGVFAIAVDGPFRHAYLRAEGRYVGMAKRVKVKSLGEQVVLEPELGALLTLQLELSPELRESPEEIDDLKVQVWTDDWEEEGRLGPRSFTPRGAVLRSDGTLEITAMRPGFPLNVHVGAAEFLDLRGKVPELEPGEHRVVALELPLGSVVTGRVVDQAGQPFVEAEVSCWADGVDLPEPLDEASGTWSVREWVSEKTDENGEFVLSPAQPGKLQITVSADEADESVEETIEVADGERVDDLEFVLQRGSDLVIVASWDDGTKAVGAKVEITAEGDAQDPNWMWDDWGESHSTDEDGRFVAVGLGGGTYTVTLHGERGAEGVEQHGFVAANGLVPGGADVLLELETLPLLEGVVTRRDGEPVTRFRVAAGRGDSSRGRSETFKREDGVFHLRGLEPGEYMVQATISRYGASPRIPIRMPEASKGDPVQIVVDAWAQLTGVVLGPDGPVDDARIELGDDDKSGNTRKDGTFKLRKCLAGRYSLVAKKNGFIDSEPFEVDLVSGELVEVTLRLRRGAYVSGVVRLANGDAPDSALVTLQRKDADQGGRFRFNRWGSHNTRTKDGTFEFRGVEEGEYTVTVLGGVDYGDASDPKGRIRAEFEVEGERDVELELDLEAPDPVRISGRILRDGTPVQGELFISDDWGFRGGRRHETDDGGSFELEVPWPGEYRIWVSVDDESGHEMFDIPDAETHRLDVEIADIEDFD